MVSVIHAFTDSSLISGVTCVDTSTMPWPGVTFSQTEGVSVDHVERSFQMLSESIGMPRDRIFSTHQVHGARIVQVDNDVDPDSTGQQKADGLMTSRSGCVLGVKLADCCGVLLYDPIRHAVAAVHSGWRGTAANIVAAAVRDMQRAYGTKPGDLRAWLSPCASGAKYEVGIDVQSQLGEFCAPHTAETWLFDNRSAITQQLIMAGLEPNLIGGDASCTITDGGLHSFRRDKARSGRMFAFIGMREKP